MKNATRRKPHGFTLIELLVVVAVIALLIGVLLPALNGARRSAWQSQGAQLQRQLLLGVQSYGLSYDFDIPGINSSGRTAELADEQNDIQKLNNAADAPTQGWDWVSPSVDEDNLPNGRLSRLHYIFDSFRDPSMRESVIVQNAPEGPDAVADVEAQRGTFSGPSFLMPFSWQLAGKTQISGSEVLAWGQQPTDEGFVDLPDGWRPNTTKLGQEARKAALSDGFAGIRNNGQATLNAEVWDDPINPIVGNTDVSFFGAFISDTPIHEGSVIFGDPKGTGPVDLQRHQLCYRHGGRMNVGYFDGHVEVMSREETYDPRLWFPKGSVMGGNEVVEEALFIVPEDEKLD